MSHELQDLALKCFRRADEEEEKEALEVGGGMRGFHTNKVHTFLGMTWSRIKWMSCTSGLKTRFMSQGRM